MTAPDSLEKIVEEMRRELAEIDADERMHYPTANVVVNAPLALIQLSMETRQRALKHYLPRIEALIPSKAERDAAQTIVDLLELGDQRLLASDGPVGGQLPNLSPAEWGKVYRACRALLDERRKDG